MNGTTTQQPNAFSLLCEGAADQNFFKALSEKRGLPKFDYLDPSKHYGVTNFKTMLMAIQGNIKSFSTLNGVLILADSASNPAATFAGICAQIKAAGKKLPVPSDLSVTARAHPATNAGMPAVRVMLVPGDDRPGCLETLCVEVLLEKNAWAEGCLDEYLSCGKSSAVTWSAEKLDKARYHCLVAALHRDDPSKAVSRAFGRSGTDSSQPLIDVTHPIFDSIAKRIQDFCGSL